MKFSLALLVSIAISNAAYISSVTTSDSAAASTTGSEWWTTLTPSSTLSGGTTDFDGSFAISLKTVASGSANASVSASPSLVKRDAVEQYSDGQLQDKTTATLSTLAATTASVINQIGDGQIQDQTTATAAATTASVINQIGDGQIQDQTTTTAAATTASVINQIGDGQIQDQTTATAAATASVINQIGDGQIQDQTTSTKANTASVINQVGDGQIQAQTTSTAAGVSQVQDGQVQATGSGSSSDSSDSSVPETCVTENSLTMTLKGGQLRDAKGRVGAIVSNRQFQFDGPPPQAGSIYAAGWSISSEGLLAIGENTTFYKCLSGDFYNLYDESIGGQCTPVEIHILKAVKC